jgi:hypothetical protein
MPRVEQSHPKRRLAIALAALTCLLLAVPFPYPPNQNDRDAIVQLALDGILHRGLVDTPQGREGLFERELLARKAGPIYFVNDVGVPDVILTSAGLLPLPKGRKVNLDGDEALVKFSFTDFDGSSRTWFMRFEYYFGSQGGCVYSVRLYKAPWLRRIVFKFLVAA